MSQNRNINKYEVHGRYGSILDKLDDKYRIYEEAERIVMQGNAISTGERGDNVPEVVAKRFQHMKKKHTS